MDRGQPMRDKPSPISVRGRRTNTLFKLKFNPSQIDQLACRYSDDDSKALKAGKEIAAGHYSSRQLRVIHEWKTRGRGRSRLVRNCCENEIAEAIRLAVSTNSERAAIAVLTELPGIDIPVASAILGVTHLKRYTIVDFRALEALSLERNTYRLNVDFYLDYLDACRFIAQETGTTLRTLDRAMWQ